MRSWSSLMTTVVRERDAGETNVGWRYMPESSEAAERNYLAYLHTDDGSGPGKRKELFENVRLRASSESHPFTWKAIRAHFAHAKAFATSPPRRRFRTRREVFPASSLFSKESANSISSRSRCLKFSVCNLHAGAILKTGGGSGSCRLSVAAAVDWES